MVKNCAIFPKSQCKKVKSQCKKVKSTADWLLKYTWHLCPIKCSDPKNKKLNKNSDIYKLFRASRKMVLRFHTTSGIEIQTLKDITRNKNTDHSTNTEQEYSKLELVKEDKMKNYCHMFRAI